MVLVQRVILCLGLAMVQGAADDAREAAFARAREDMVRTQIESRGIRDPRVLEAMRQVPRHRFVPSRWRDASYEDRPLPIGFGQTISQPYIVALMTAALELEGDEKVLEIGTGSGYQAAVLAHVAGEVYTIEIVPELAERARGTLADLGLDHVHVRHGDGWRGWPEEAPFDAIMVTAAPVVVPQPLLDQLAPGGRLVVPVGAVHQDLLRIRKTPQGAQHDTLAAVRFVPMTGSSQQDGDRDDESP